MLETRHGIVECHSPVFVTFLDLFTTSRNRYSVIYEQSNTVKSLGGDEPTTITRESMEAERRARGSLHLASISICRARGRQKEREVIQRDTVTRGRIDDGSQLYTGRENETESENPPLFATASSRWVSSYRPRDQIYPRYLRLLSAWLVCNLQRSAVTR